MKNKLFYIFCIGIVFIPIKANAGIISIDTYFEENGIYKGGVVDITDGDLEDEMGEYYYDEFPDEKPIEDMTEEELKEHFHVDKMDLDGLKEYYKIDESTEEDIKKYYRIDKLDEDFVREYYDNKKDKTTNNKNVLNRKEVLNGDISEYQTYKINGVEMSASDIIEQFNKKYSRE